MNAPPNSPALSASDSATPCAVVTVDAPCRLHFGLLSFGRTAGRNYGGLGMMIAPPHLRMRFEPAESFDVVGPSSDEVRRAVRRWLAWEQRPKPPACRIVVEAAPPRHSGLGSGTQLALATAAGLRRFVGLPDLSATEYAPGMQRGERSAIGTHGFDRGGLLFEWGKTADAPLAALAERVETPEAWRFVLCRAEATAEATAGVSGGDERQAFAQLPAVSHATEHALQCLATDEILPAARAADFERFAEHLYEYGHLAGKCFAAVQGGPFASAAIARLVASLRAAGVRGVGQSSWGPTVYAACRCADEAEQLAETLRTASADRPPQIEIARPYNRGAAILQTPLDA